MDSFFAFSLCYYLIKNAKKNRLMQQLMLLFNFLGKWKKKMTKKNDIMSSILLGVQVGMPLVLYWFLAIDGLPVHLCGKQSYWFDKYLH